MSSDDARSQIRRRRHEAIRAEPEPGWLEEAHSLSRDPESLRIHTETDADGHVLRLSGELDLASAGELDTAIAELCTDGAKRISLEMEELSFMDSTGLRSVLVGQELCEVNGCELMIGTLSAQVRRLLEVSGVGEKLAFRPDAV